jgi:D-alanyl-D-alanine-carboxypeptidase/D-alanyl-D-alanine-endopeptidase
MRVTLLVACLLVAGASAAADPADQALVDAARIVAAKLPAGGIVVAVSTAGARQAWGFGRPRADSALAPERIRFELGSLSKSFNAVLLARAVRRGQARWNDPITAWLPPMALADGNVSTITLLQLANHRSGLPRLPANLVLTSADDPYAAYGAQELIAAVVAEHLAQAPPAAVSYSNYGAGLLGHLLAARRGLTWAGLLAADLTGPAKLGDTTALPDVALDVRLAQPHVGAQTVPAWRFAALAAAGAVRGSAADLLAFGEGLLGADPELAADWAELVAHTDDASGPGLFRDPDADPPAWWHNGATNGSRSYLRLCPAQRRVEVVLANQAEVDPQAIIAAAHPPPRAPAISPPPGWERELPGVYRFADGPELTLVAEGGGLRAQLTGQSFLALVCTGPDAWRWQEVAARLAIERDDTGKVVAIVLRQNGQVLRFVRRP